MSPMAEMFGIRHACIFEHPIHISGIFGCSKSIIWTNIMSGKMDEWLFSLNIQEIQKLKTSSALGSSDHTGIPTPSKSAFVHFFLPRKDCN